jgi:hypothetical protein
MMWSLVVPGRTQQYGHNAAGLFVACSSFFPFNGLADAVYSTDLSAAFPVHLLHYHLLLIRDDLRKVLLLRLRLAGRHVPAIYGPSGDVKWDEADPTCSLEAAKRA